MTDTDQNPADAPDAEDIAAAADAVTGDEDEALSEELQAAAEEDEAHEPSPEELIEQLQAELAEAQEERLRALAEAENTRRRTAREAENLRKYAVEPLARNLLSVVDNLHRALEAVPADKAEADGDLKNLRTGVELTVKELDSVFERSKIEVIDPAGELFDPNLHQAMFEIPTADAEPGTVMQVVAKGYRLHDRLIRAAMVGVAKAAG